MSLRGAFGATKQSPVNEKIASDYRPRNDIAINMTLPAFLFALLIAFLYGALYHVLRGGGVWRLIFYLGLSTVGFAVGYLIGYWLGLLLIPIGSMDLGSASIGSLIFLVGGDWLSRIEVKPESKV